MPAEEAAAAAAKRKEASKQALSAEVCGKFTALLAIFSTDVQLQGEFQKEFQALADRQLELLKKAVDDGQCTTGVAGLFDGGDEDDSLSKVVKETVDMLKVWTLSYHHDRLPASSTLPSRVIVPHHFSQSGGTGGATGGGGEDELLSKLTEQLSGLDNDPNMQGMFAMRRSRPTMSLSMTTMGSWYEVLALTRGSGSGHGGNDDAAAFQGILARAPVRNRGQVPGMAG